MNLATLVQDSAAKIPTKIALRDRNLRVSYSAFAKAIDRVAAALVAEGVGPSAQVGIEIADSYAHWVATLAVMRAGAATASLDSRSGGHRARVVGFDHIVSTNSKSDLRESARKFVPATDAWVKSAEAEGQEKALPDPHAASRSLGRIVFSSGTTGIPKGVLIASESLRNNILFHARDVDENTHFLSGYGIDSAQGRTLATWAAGGTVGLGYSSRAKEGSLARMVVDTNYVSTSSASLVGILNSMKGDFAGKEHRIVRVGGASLPVQLRDEALRRFCSRILLSYATMEAGPITVGDSSVLDRHPGAVGYRLDCAQLEIVDDTGREVEAGQIGLVRTKSRHMAQAYINNADETSRFFRDGWFCPGDIAIKQEDGLVVILGRESDVLNIGGAKFSANVVEHEVRQVEGVEDACAVAFPNRRGVNTMVILVVCGDTVSQENLRKKISRRLAKIELRNFVVKQVPSIPRNERGKVSRSALAKALSNIPTA